LAETSTFISYRQPNYKPQWLSATQARWSLAE